MQCAIAAWHFEEQFIGISRLDLRLTEYSQ